MKTEESGAEVGAGCMLALIGVVVGTLTRGYTLSVLWAWFVVTKFHVVTLSVAQALGLSLVVGMFVPIKADDSKYKGKGMLYLGIYSCLYPVTIAAMALGMGWVVRQFL